MNDEILGINDTDVGMMAAEQCNGILQSFGTHANILVGFSVAGKPIIVVATTATTAAATAIVSFQNTLFNHYIYNPFYSESIVATSGTFSVKLSKHYFGLGITFTGEQTLSSVPPSFVAVEATGAPPSIGR